MASLISPELHASHAAAQGVAGKAQCSTAQTILASPAKAELQLLDTISTVGH